MAQKYFDSRRVIIFSTLYYPAIGGAWQVMQNIAEGLVKKGHDVTVLTARAEFLEDFEKGKTKELRKREIINGVLVIRLRVFKKLHQAASFLLQRFELPRLIREFLDILSFGPIFLTFWQFIFVAKPRIIIATHFLTAFYGLILSKIKKTPLLVVPCFHPGSFLHESRGNLWLLSRANFIGVFTSLEEKELIKRKIPPKKIIEIGIGVKMPEKKAQIDEKLKTILKNKKVVLFLGRLDSYKGIIELIEAMRKVWTVLPNTALVVAGAKTGFTQEIRKKIKRLSTKEQKRVILLKNINQAQKWYLLSRSNLLVNFSQYESFGLVFLEAWLFKKPVIGSDRGVIPEVISHKKNGFIVPYADREKLAEAILFILKNPILARKLGKMGFKKAKQCDIENVIIKIESIIKKS